MVSSAVLISQTISSTLPLGSRAMSWGDLFLVVELEVPDEIAFPGEFLNPPAAAGSAEDLFLAADLSRAQQVPILEQVSVLARSVLALPRPDDPSLHVNQVRLGRL
jgi:hypothetical protein